jgi:hypothetical protein
MRMFLAGFKDLIRRCRGVENTCTCAFCLFWRKEKVLLPGAKPATEWEAKKLVAKKEYASPVPNTSTALMSMMMCEKPDCTPDCGFITKKFPVHSLCCQYQWLSEKDRSFVDEKILATGATIAKCSTCTDKIVLKSPECKYLASDEQIHRITYNKYIGVPGSVDVSTGAVSKKRDVQETVVVSPAVFMERFIGHLSTIVHHKYVVDFLDAVADVVIRRKRAGHLLFGLDFGMSYEVMHGNEVKNEFFQHVQVSIHTTLQYLPWAPRMMKYYDADKHPNKALHANIFLSDDPSHDPAFVLNNFNVLLPIFDAKASAENMPIINWTTFMSDGGPGHYKQRHNFYNITLKQFSLRKLREYKTGISDH